jgi:malonate-semialdehyde dehydrogenase (acetylating) / methylmalonate-semialdehyde dehydrogenase
VELANYVNGRWCKATASESLPVLDPATAGVLGRVPLSAAADVDHAVGAGIRAFDEWRDVPVIERVQFLFRLKRLLEENLEDLARTITRECGKTLAESRGELRRGIENVETACGIPILMQGSNNEDIAPGVDEHLFRQPLGVVAAITPFNLG